MTVLAKPGDVKSMTDVISALEMLEQATADLLIRSSSWLVQVIDGLMKRAYNDKAQAASHLIMHYQVIEIIGECFTKVKLLFSHTIVTACHVDR